jgi:hypothetical protein
MKRPRRVAGLAVGLCIAGALPLLAGQAASAPGSRRGPDVPPPPPDPPATMSRGADGGATIRAVRLAEPLDIDGRLDDRVYATVTPASGFIQQDPREGELATEQTDVWILFDDQNIYVAARCWDSQPEREVENEMRRDAIGIVQNESFGITLDTFGDRRNGLVFMTSSLGGLRDSAVTDETSNNVDWNTVWDARTAKFENGWMVEFVIPFKSLRYKRGTEQAWGIQMRREVRWKNETSFLTLVPAFLGNTGMWAVSLAATIAGLEVPGSGNSLEVKPYAIAGVRTDRLASPPIDNKGDRDIGVDVKYGISKSLTLDLTYNTDFAQVEDDLQQVNLTRFNLFFPERRDFFLEGEGIFGFGGVGVSAGGGGISPTNNTPVLFFSRRIGINNARPVPIVGGVRLTGRVGGYSLGALNIQSDDEIAASARATNFTVLRVKRDLFRRSNIGLIYTRRAETQGDRDSGETYGVDGLYSASRSLNVNGYVATTRRPEAQSDNVSYLGRFDYNTDRYGAQLEQLYVGGGFNPDVGFLRRTDFTRRFAELRFSPRPARTRMRAVRKFVYLGRFDHFENGAGIPEWREVEASFGMQLQTGDNLSVRYLRDYEFIPRPFEIATGVFVPVGGYDFQSATVSYLFGQQRPVSGTASYQEGSLYGGRKRTVGLSSGRIELSSHLQIEPSISANWVTLAWGDFTSTVVSTRYTYMVSPRMFVSALLQYNSSLASLSTNVRFRWEYRLGSELFVVYSDGRDTIAKGFPELVNRAFVVKINRLVRF